MNAERLLTLAKAMGYDAKLSISYASSPRVIYHNAKPVDDELYGVFDPINNPRQALEVAAWLLSREALFLPRGITLCENAPPVDVVPHDGTPDSLIAAIVEAACRVAESRA